MSYASIEEAMVNGHGIERSFICHAHDDHNASASVNSVSGLWYCYSCHAAGRFDLSRMELDPYEVKRSLEHILERVDRVQRVYPESWLSQFDATGPGKYWLSRYTEEAAKAHRLGQNLSDTYATIPFRDNIGQVLGVIRRDLSGRDPAKYRYPHEVDMGNYLYNHHRITGNSIMLTEGATDAIAAEEAGHPAAMAVYGSKLTQAQVKLLKKLDPARVVIAFDQDAAGHDGYAKAVFQLPFFQVVRASWPHWKDLASIPLPIRKKIVAALA